MRKATLVALMAGLVGAAFLAGGAVAAVKQYQFTGELVELDAKAKTLTVKKGDETWDFSTEGLKDFKAKKGDRLTVYYSMLARKVEVK